MNGRWRLPGRKVIVFKRDVGICNSTPYIDLREHAEGLVILETVEKNMGMFIKKKLERAQQARVIQRQCAHPTGEHLKRIVSQRSLKNIPIRIPTIPNATTLLGTSVSGLKQWSTRKKVKREIPGRLGFRYPRNSTYWLNKFITIPLQATKGWFTLSWPCDIHVS